MTFNRLFQSVLIGLVMGGLAAAGTAAAQPPVRGSKGFIRMFDAVSVGSGRLDFILNGQSVRPAGYQLGNVTGGIAVKPGTSRVGFRRDGIAEGETVVVVAADETVIVIPFAEEVAATASEPAHWQIRILRLKQYGIENQRTASFVSVAPEPELRVELHQLDGKWQPLVVKRLSIARSEIQQARGYLAVRCAGQPLSTISVGAAGNFVSVLYHDEQGVLRSKTFQDYKYLSTE